MIKFGDNNIFVGYLKQLLKSFNLPTYRVYTKELSDYLRANGKESPRLFKSLVKDGKLTRYIPYIRNGEIQYFDGLWHKVGKVFSYDTDYIDHTRRFHVEEGTTYDTYTHEYLGDYLRFIRDYYHVDLMPLYNCFSNRFITDLYKVGDGYKFDSRTDRIYAVPVKLFKDYTIAADGTIEIFCGLYAKYFLSSMFQQLHDRTYRKYNSLSFSQPILYNALEDLGEIDTDELSLHENSLRLFLKVPTGSSIVILEGDYRDWNDNNLKKLSFNNRTIWKRTSNHFITNYAESNTAEGFKTKKIPEDREFKPITELQLLKLNTGTSYPFADRLMEYLANNVVSPLDTIADNTKRAEKVISMNVKGVEVDGLWTDRIRPIVYDYAVDHGFNFDTLGYIDKDIEKYYTAWQKEYLLDRYGNRIPVRDKAGSIIWQYYDYIVSVDGESPRADREDMPVQTAYSQYLWAESDEIITDENGRRIPKDYRYTYKPLATIADVDIYEGEE